MRQIRIAALIAPSLASLGLLILALAPEAGAGRRAATATSGDGIWERIDNSSIAAADWQPPAAGSYRVLRLNKDALAQQLARAPMERTGDLRNSPAVLSVPMPDGSFVRFHIEESPVMDAELVARYPEIKSYRGQGIDDQTATVRLDWTPLGFHALILSAGHAVNILPPNQGDVTTYASSYVTASAFDCGVSPEDHPSELKTRLGTPDSLVAPTASVGATLRTFRIAVAVDNEFCVEVGGNTVAGSTAAINTFLNGINAIWERELSVHLNLVSAPNVIYAGDNVSCGGACTDANDPYTNGEPSTMHAEGRADLATKVGPANYDVGHALGTGSSGAAFVGVVCRETLCNGQPGACKGGGASLLSAPAGNDVSVGLWAHELGHQFGGNHTQNGFFGLCDSAREPATAFESGSGITIMSYVGTCEEDNIAAVRDLRFHAGTFAEINTFLTSGQASCAVSTVTGNNIPTVSAGSPFTIPKQTPFTLTATGTDADAADIPNLTFVWEQVDAGGTAYMNPPYDDQPGGDPSTSTRPLFRPFAPVKDKSRTFPSLTYILNNANVPPPTVAGFQTAENLPSISRTMNFRVTARDNRTGRSDSSVAITVEGNAGPFAVTAPNGGETFSGVRTLTWSVNNTNVAPVGVSNVKITLSSDGGQSFPITLAASTPNTGTANVTFPNGIASTTARVKVEAIGNIFFDVSDGDFTLLPADTCAAVSDISPQAGTTGDTVTITGVNFSNSGNVIGVKFSSNVAAPFNVVNDSTITATVPAGTVSGPLTLSKTGCPDAQSPSFTVCPNAPVELKVDDGGAEIATGLGNGAYYVNRLTPSTYPATLSQISIFWVASQNFPAGTPITVVAGANPGGSETIDGTNFQSFAATSGTPPGPTTYTLPKAITITSGDFVVGYSVPIVPAGGNATAVDTTNLMSRSYSSTDGIFFQVDTDGNYMIRAAQVFTNCSVTPEPRPAVLGNISTRLRVETGDNVLIGGFIITGTQPKKVIVRAVGPSLPVVGKLEDPTLELFGPSGLITSNDNWRSTQEAEIIASTVPPTNDLESAIVATLAANGTGYTAIVRGVNNTTGVGLVEIYDLDSTVDSKLANISTRGLVQTGDNVMIGGFILLGTYTQKVIVRAIGPSLPVPGHLADPTLELHDSNGVLFASNDNWRNTQEAEIIATTIPPPNDAESAIVQTLAPAAYTAIVRGVNGTTGVALVEVYALSP